MLKYIIKRLLISVVILIGVSMIIYFLIRLMPVDYVERRFSADLIQGKISYEDIERMKELYGINDNSFLGIIKGYFTWLGSLLRLDLGMSFKYQRSVTDVISEYMWVSFGVALVAMVIYMIIAIPLGIKTATKQYGAADYTISIFSMAGIALPSYFFAALLLKIFSSWLGWFPLQGLSDATINWQGDPFGALLDNIHHLVLPILCIVVLSVGHMMRYTRTNMLETLNSDFIRTARAKGLSERKVANKHAFRNTLVPLVTMTAGILPGLFGGSMIIEQAFQIPGIGLKAYEALLAGDIPFIMGYNMFLAVLTVIGTLLSDLMYGLVDPRVRLVK